MINIQSKIQKNTNQIKAVQGQLDRGLRQLMGSGENEEQGLDGPSYASDVQTGGIASNIAQSIGSGNFDPNTSQVGQQMFGEQMPGSFDRNMGMNMNLQQN